MQSVWDEVDDFFGQRLAPSDPVLDAVLRANRDAGLPAIDVSALQGKMLGLLATMSGAKRVLEIGTLGGYSTIWLARAVGEGAAVVSLEANARHADVARANIAAAGLSDRVEVRTGRAADTLPTLVGGDPFDLVFIDADKPSNPLYLDWAIKLSRAGGVIVVDNVVRGGRVADAESSDPNVLGVRQMTDLIAADPRLTATAIQTVGHKGYDGFVLALVGSGR